MAYNFKGLLTKSENKPYKLQYSISPTINNS